MSSNTQETIMFMRCLEKFHTLLRTATGGLLDMDHIQAWVHKSLPVFNLETSVMTVIGSMVFWTIVFFILHYFAIQTFMSIFKSTKWAQAYFKLSDYDRITFTSYTHAIIHANLAAFGATYSYIYADGKPGTCYFYNDEYQNTMYDFQKFFNSMTGGYLMYDIIFCTIVFKKDSLMMQTYGHHVAGIIGALFSIYLDGYYGSIAQLTMITEASTFNVNFRVLLNYAGLGDHVLYAINGLAMTLVFFIVRVIYYTWVICIKFPFPPPPSPMLLTSEFWQTYPAHKQPCLAFCLIVYTLMAFLQFFWFHKMYKGCMKALKKAFGGAPKVEKQS